MPEQTELLALLSALVGENPGVTARQLVRLVADAGHPAVDKSAVNRILYAHTSVFRYDSAPDSAPCWSLIAGATRLSGLAAVPESTPRLSHPALYTWQREALDAWRSSGCRGVIEAVTGTGKTVLGIAAAAEELAESGRVLVLVPTIELQEQWLKRLGNNSTALKLGALGGGSRSDFDEAHVLVAVINSARTADLRIPHRALVIADECHRYGSAMNSEALDPRFTKRLVDCNS